MSQPAADANHRSWLTKAAYFDPAGDILAVHVDGETGEVKEASQFAEKMQARALKLAARDPNSAVHAWIDGHHAGRSFTMLEMMQGFLKHRDVPQFATWTRLRVLKDRQLVSHRLDPDQVDWEAISFGLLFFLGTQIPQPPD